MRNGQTRRDLCVRLIIISLGKLMAVLSHWFLIYKYKNILVNRTLAQATIRESDAHLLFTNKNQFMDLYPWNEGNDKILQERSCYNIIFPTLVLIFRLWIWGIYLDKGYYLILLQTLDSMLCLTTHYLEWRLSW